MNSFLLEIFFILIIWEKFYPDVSISRYLFCFFSARYFIEKQQQSSSWGLNQPTDTFRIQPHILTKTFKGTKTTVQLPTPSSPQLCQTIFYFQTVCQGYLRRGRRKKKKLERKNKSPEPKQHRKHSYWTPHLQLPSLCGSSTWEQEHGWILISQTFSKRRWESNGGASGTRAH